MHVMVSSYIAHTLFHTCPVITLVDQPCSVGDYTKRGAITKEHYLRVIYAFSLNCYKFYQILHLNDCVIKRDCMGALMDTFTVLPHSTRTTYPSRLSYIVSSLCARSSQENQRLVDDGAMV